MCETPETGGRLVLGVFLWDEKSSSEMRKDKYLTTTFLLFYGISKLVTTKYLFGDV
jgi:hypothetical protein